MPSLNLQVPTLNIPRPNLDLGIRERMSRLSLDNLRRPSGCNSSCGSSFRGFARALRTVPWVALLSITAFAAGLAVWWVNVNLARSSTIALFDLTLVERSTFPRLQQADEVMGKTTLGIGIAAAVVIGLQALLTLLHGAISEEMRWTKCQRKIDDDSRSRLLRAYLVMQAMVNTLIWFLVMCVVLQLMVSTAWLLWALAGQRGVTEVLVRLDQNKTMRGTPPAVGRQQPGTTTCPATCVNIVVVRALMSDRNRCICEQEAIQQLAALVNEVLWQVRWCLVGLVVMYLAGSLMLMKTSSMFTSIRLEYRQCGDEGMALKAPPPTFTPAIRSIFPPSNDPHIMVRGGPMSGAWA